MLLHVASIQRCHSLPAVLSQKRQARAANEQEEAFLNLQLVHLQDDVSGHGGYHSDRFHGRSRQPGAAAVAAGPEQQGDWQNVQPFIDCDALVVTFQRSCNFDVLWGHLSLRPRSAAFFKPAFLLLQQILPKVALLYVRVKKGLPSSGVQCY